MSIKEQLLYVTTRIETEDSQGKHYSGTGFFYSLKKTDGQSVIVVVTNKHVVKDMIKGSFVLTEEQSGQGTPADRKFVSVSFDNFEKQWIMHPSPDVDLCVMPLNALVEKVKADHNIEFFFRTLSESAIPNEADFDNIDAIEDVLMIGYPNGLWDDVNNRPIVRKGLTATDVKADYKGQKEFVIDMACIPGSSGSPVIILKSGMSVSRSGDVEIGGTEFFFIGVLHAGLLMTIEGEIQIKGAPISTALKPVVQSQIMINLGYCVKSSCLKDFEKLV